ncbi:WD40-repeat-containing domain protein [Suillus placidus]|uniref:WD40-repeat-containing domain protein n=1 Tax=Suillus placidus TaxID=48579 RepID=A0A9P7A213_9AGAM|nr:WD40-repeat-containing domain protein [Suillus placidus]
MTSGPSARPILEEASTPAVQAKRSTPKHEFEGHEEDICDFIFLHDNVHIVSGSEDGTMRKWNCDTGRRVGKPWKGEGGRIFALALSPDGTIVACGREDGSVQRWTTHGKMIKGVWTGHSKAVHSLSWSPSGSHFSSGSEDGTIFIRQAKSGKVTVGPIETQHNTVLALAYSPSGDRITSGGKFQGMIYIWDAKTGKSVLGPIQFKDRSPVTSLVWLDNTKICCASDLFIRFFDSKSGQLLHRFHHHNHVNSIALSPKHNVLACVGRNGMVELWDTESHESLGQPFHHHDDLYHVSFSRDGRYVAYSGENGKLTLWTVKDIAPQLPAPTLLPQSDRRSTQQETRPNSPSSSCLDADATGGGGFIEEAHDDPYNNFFQSSQQSLPSASPGSHLPNLSLARHFWKGIFRRRPPPDNSIPKERSKRKFFTRRARSDSPLELATIKPNQPVPEGKMGEGEGEQGENINDVSAVWTLAHWYLNVTAVSMILRMISSATERMKANSEMMVLLPTRRAHRLMIALPPPISTARIIENSGNDWCRLETKFLHSVPHIPALDLHMHPNQYCANPGTGILAYSQQDPLDVPSMLLLAAMKIDMALLLNRMRKRLQPCFARMMMWPTFQRDQVNLQWWHKCLKDGLHKHIPRQAGQKKSSMKE